MIIDRTHRGWFWVSLALLAAGAVVYVFLRPRVTGDFWAGSWPGLGFAFAGTLMMVFAWLLAARKRVPTWHVGAVRRWLKGHIWLGLLSLPMILFHGDFRFGGALTTWLMVLFLVVFASGILGLALQQFLPRLMLERVEMETVYEEIPNVLAALRREADGLVTAVCGPIPGLEPVAADVPHDVRGRIRPRSLAARQRLSTPTAIDVDERLPETERLKDVYVRTIRDFLDPSSRPSGTLTEKRHSSPFFRDLRLRLPASLHETVGELEEICQERRQLALQARLHHWLHGWLFVHVPLSAALFVLTGFHVALAWRY